MFSLDEKVAVVIGGEGVLAGEIALGLAEQGAAVVVPGLSSERAEARVAPRHRHLGAHLV